MRERKKVPQTGDGKKELEGDEGLELDEASKLQ